MIRSLAVLIVPLLLIAFLFTRIPRDHPVQQVAWQPVLATARAQAPYSVLAPVNLPDSWRPTTVTWVRVGEPFLNGEPAARNTWQLGYLDPDNVYVGLQQGDLQPDEMVADVSRDGVPDGQSQVGGHRWERRVSADGRTRSLVLSTSTVTTVVSGDVDYPVLESYAAALRSR